MITVRGMRFRDEDDAYEYFRQEEIDAEGQSMNKRNAAGISPEELSLQDAFMEGMRAGGMQLSPSLNPYQDSTPEHAAWERGRQGAASIAAARLVA